MGTCIMGDCLEDDWADDGVNRAAKISTEKSWRGTRHIHSLWTLGILVALVGSISLIPPSSIGGWRQHLGLLVPQPSSDIGLDIERTKLAQYGNATSSSARLFRNTDEKGYPASVGGQSRPQSMYESLWPGYKLPNWARKVPHFRDLQPPKGHSICYVHVGKTAGSSIGCALGFNLHCGDDKQYLPGRLPKSATNAFHKDVFDCPATSDFYLYVVRDPLARARSAFVYGRPDEHGHTNEGKLWDTIKQIYLDCGFSTAHELAASGLSDGGGASGKCKQLAADMLRGKSLYEAHLFYNYQYYVESIPHKSNILVIRTEHMEEDWNKIEIGLGGRQRNNLTFPHDNSKPNKEERDLNLGDEERMLLCHELCVEIQTYKLLLRKALNIDEVQYNASMSELQASCPNEAMQKQCDFHTPNIKKKLIENRGFPKPLGS